MAQHDYIISNQTFPNTRADLNNVLQAIATCNKGSSAPTTQYAGQMWIDDSAGTTWTLYLYDGSDNIQVATIDTTANTINFIDSVVTGFDIVTDTTPQLGGVLDTNGNNIEFGDSTGAEVERLKFGASDDLQIYKASGGNSYIQETGTNNLRVCGTEVFLRDGADTENLAVFRTNGANELYYDNSKKFETTSTGVDVTGNLSVTGNILTSEGSATTPSLQLNDNDTGLFDAGANAIGFTTNGSEKVRIVQGGSVGIGTTNPAQKLDVNGTVQALSSILPEGTLTDGATISWDVSASAVAKVTLGGNRTISAPSNSAGAGQFISLLVIQDGTGSRTLTWNAVYEFASDTAPTLTTTGGKGDLFVFRYNGTKWLEVGRNLNLTLS